MEKLRVLKPFRDIADFSIRHEPGDVIEVSDPIRAGRLLNGGLCAELEDAAVQRPNGKDTGGDALVDVTASETGAIPDSTDSSPVPSGGEGTDDGDGVVEAAETEEKTAVKKSAKKGTRKQ